MDWLSSNWLWLSLLGLFVVLHLFGHRHGRQAQPEDEDRASSPSPISGAHHGCCGGHGAHAGSHHVPAHSGHAHGEHDCCGVKKNLAETPRSDSTDEPVTQRQS